MGVIGKGYTACEDEKPTTRWSSVWGGEAAGEVFQDGSQWT